MAGLLQQCFATAEMQSMQVRQVLAHHVSNISLLDLRVQAYTLLLPIHLVPAYNQESNVLMVAEVAAGKLLRKLMSKQSQKLPEKPLH